LWCVYATEGVHKGGQRRRRSGSGAGENRGVSRGWGMRVCLSVLFFCFYETETDKERGDARAYES